MQVAVVEFARNVCGMPGANSTEFNAETSYPVIHLMDEQRSITDKGGTMRLGSYECVIPPETKAFEIYCRSVISERHRHRYEFNLEYKDKLEAKGLRAGGLSPDGKLVEMVEYRDHPWFVGCQFHPEFKSRPMDPHPLFASYIGACLAYKNRKARGQEGQDAAQEEKKVSAEKRREAQAKVRKLRVGSRKVS
jgi:CTP synthase